MHLTEKTKQTISLGLLFAVYALCGFRYFPGRIADSLQETFLHLLTVAPFSLGFTIIVVGLLQRLGGGRLPFDRALRIYLTASIIMEFFIGLYHYLDHAG